jgi:ubiquinone/menaquinone biosynthesis C-methylase UbiE
MDDLKSTSLNKHKEAVKSWWNSEHTKQKWHGQTYTPEFDTHLHYWIRQEKTLKLLDELNLPKGSRILELGYGGAETAGKILERGFIYYGVDISKHLYENAKKNYSNYIKNEQAYFYQGSLEEKLHFEDNFFDLVIICGAIHYAGKLSNNFLEVKRVLKQDGHYIIGQGNMFTLNDLINFRKLLKCIIWYFTNEKYIYSYSLSFKDIIFESRLKKYFLKYENNNFFKSNFMNKKSNSWKYKIHKRIFSFSSLKKTIENNEFHVAKFYGGPFLYASENKNSIIKKILNNTFQYLLDKKIFIFLIKIADNFVFLSKPNQKL